MENGIKGAFILAETFVESIHRKGLQDVMDNVFFFFLFCFSEKVTQAFQKVLTKETQF